MTDSFKYLLANIYNWLVVAITVNLRGITDWLSAAAVLAAIVLSILSAIKIRADYKLIKLKKEREDIEREICNQKLMQERLKTGKLRKQD